MAVKKITWTKSAILQLNKSIEFIREESPQNAEKVKGTILENYITSIFINSPPHRQVQAQ